MGTACENGLTAAKGKGYRLLCLGFGAVLGLILLLSVVLVAGAESEPPSATADGEAAQGAGTLRWFTETVDSTGHVGEYASLAMDGDGNPHVSYYAPFPNPYRLKYAWISGTAWLSETVDDDGRVGLFTSLALAPTSPYTPHISYYESTNRDLRYARRTPSGWMTYTVNSGGNVAFYSSLALEPVSPYTPHIAYCDVTGNALIHAWLGGTTWYSEVVESRAGYVAGYISLALAPVSPYTLHIAYQDGSPGFYDLKHAWRTSTSWLSETVDSQGNIGEHASIALEPISPFTPHISYHDATGTMENLKHAWWTPSGWLSETVDATGDVGKYSSLALEPILPYTPHIAYFDDTNDDLRHAWRTPTGWLTETVDSEGEVGAHSSLALEPMPPYAPHIAYFDDTDDDLKHAWLAREFYLYLPLVLKE